jgi:hypothetical protein
MCDVHEVPLRTSRLSVERLLCGAIRNPAWLGEVRASMFPAMLCTDLTRMQRLIRALELRCSLPKDVRDRARVLRDLALLAGTRFEGGSLIDWSVALEEDAARKLYWGDTRGRALNPSAVREPRGTLEVRQLAMRVATLILRRLFEKPAFERPEDVAIGAALNLLQSQSELAQACDRMLRTWSDGYQALWALAFELPGRGGAGYFARRYRVQLPESSVGDATTAEATS